MRHALVFLLFGLYLCGYGLWLGGWGLLLLWAGLSYVAVALAYWMSRPELFGKRPDGTLPLLNQVLLLPYLLMTWGVWHGLRLVKRENAHDRINKGLTIGRRIYPRELPEGIEAVVDLTAEFTEPKAIRQAGAYIANPILDNHTPPVDELERLIERIHGLGHLYVHCAEGHGRAALIGACVLLRRGAAESPEAALQMLKAKRPLVRPRGGQWETLVAYAERLREPIAQAVAPGP